MLSIAASFLIATPVLFVGSLGQIPNSNPDSASNTRQQLQVVDRGVSKEFKKEVQDTLDAIPDGIKDLLARRGWKLVMAKSVVGEAPELKGQHPRGRESGTTWEHVEGVPLESRKTIVIAQYRLSDDNKKWILTNRAPGVLRHELGHVVDILLGSSGSWFSDSAEFKAPYARDTKQINAPDQKLLEYFLQPGSAGRQEAFAEIFALLTGGPAVTNSQKRQALGTNFTEVKKLIQKKIDDLR